jgi:Mg-chelatase subunit ChlD
MLFFNRKPAAPPPQPQPVLPAKAMPAKTMPAPIHCADMLALVVFNDNAKSIGGFVSAHDTAFIKAVHALPSAVGGSTTNITAGLRVANDMLARMPHGLRRRIWLLTDGHAKCEVAGIWKEVHRAKAAYTNINALGIGDPDEFDRDLLMRIAGATHRGRYYEPQTIAALGCAFRDGAARKVSHKGEATVFVIDASGSMVLGKMGDKTRIEAVREAMVALVNYKRQMWS